MTAEASHSSALIPSGRLRWASIPRTSLKAGFLESVDDKGLVVGREIAGTSLKPALAKEWLS